MAEIEKVSDIGVEALAEYLRIAELDDSDRSYLTTILTSAKEYIKAYTGLTADQIDEHADIIPVVYVLVQDMYDTRAMYVDSGNVNRVVETILGMHQYNLL